MPWGALGFIFAYMLNQEAKEAIQKAISDLQHHLEGFTPRATQNKMIAEVANTLAGTHEKHLVALEAPTGTGKTFAYLIPSIILAKQMGVKLIISSSNISLQEQLQNKDIPELVKHTDLAISVNLAKGRSRYVCIRDMLNLSEENTAESLVQEALFSAPVDAEEMQYVSTLIGALETGAWNGEQDTLEPPLSREVWQKISCNRFTCSGSACEFYDDCIFFKARKRMHTCDVIIANHDLILADVASGNTILPDITESFIIFDEAHHLMHKSLTHFDYECSLEGLVSSLKQADTITKRINGITEIDKYIATIEVKDTTKELTRAISEMDAKWQEDIILFDSGKIPDVLAVLCNNILIGVHTIYNLFDDVVASWKDYLQTHTYAGADKSAIDEGITHTIMYLQQVIRAFENFSMVDEGRPQARWLRRNTGSAKTQFYIHSAKINVSAELESMLFSKVQSAVLTSATLSSLNSFDRMNAQLGLHDDSCRYFRLPSPFDMSKGEFVIANMQHSPKDYEEHTKEVAEYIMRQVHTCKSEGVLILFASNAQMHTVYQQLTGKIAHLWVQGKYSKSEILTKHCQTIDAGNTSVIFGLDSFSEGVDLKGAYLTIVIIAKLRFTVPNSPLEKTANDYLSSRGQNPFMTSSLPDASLRLIQASGRLIRSSTDSGKIIVLDNRLKTARWGRALLEALPAYTIVEE